MHSTTQDILAGKWHELKGKVRMQWGEITDDEVARMKGRSEELAGLLQQRYGYGKAKAEAEIARWLEGCDPGSKH